MVKRILSGFSAPWDRRVTARFGWGNQCQRDTGRSRVGVWKRIIWRCDGVLGGTVLVWGIVVRHLPGVAGIGRDGTYEPPACASSATMTNRLVPADEPSGGDLDFYHGGS